MYSEKYLEHFQTPRNAGAVDNPDASSEVRHEGGGCFDRVMMTMAVENGTMREVKYKLRACSGTIAACSAVTTLAEGKSLDDASKIDFDAVTEELDGIPDKKKHSVELAVEALQSTIADYHNGGGR